MTIKTVLIDLWFDGFEEDSHTKLEEAEVINFVEEYLDSGGVSIYFQDWKEIETFIHFCKTQDLQLDTVQIDIENMANQIWEKLNEHK